MKPDDLQTCHRFKKKDTVIVKFKMQEPTESWYSIECCCIIFHLKSLSSNKNFRACCTYKNSDIIQWKDLENDHNSSLLSKPSNLELLVNQFNNATPENNNDPIKNSNKNLFT